jgi:hypothetical protein
MRDDWQMKQDRERSGFGRSRLAAPQENRGVLIEPPADLVGDMLSENVRLRFERTIDLGGRSLAEISRLARAELLAAARQWTAAYRDVASDATAPDRPIFLAGHQPQMFHPGVWAKNFALSALAARHNAAAVNLIVDNDVLSAASLRVPGGSIAEPTAEPIPFDRPDPKVPYEDRRIEDRDLFGSFAERVAERIAPLGVDPQLRRYWPMVLARAGETDNLGACLTQARHLLEASLWGLETLEVPQSRVCEGEAFSWFVAHLLARLPEFRVCHNEAIREYRRTHRVRSHSHPAPELAEDEAWREAPFWVWTADDPRRRRLFAQAGARETLLSDRQNWQARLPLHAEGDFAPAVDRFMELSRAGVRIRPRALMTTLWARMALSDLFIHGIGGAKYDEVTDRLIERFWGIAPPRFLVVSATLRLPIERTAADLDAPRTIRLHLRDLTYHPEQFLDGLSGHAAELAASKRRWIDTPATVQTARQRCQAIREINAALQPWLDDRRSDLLALQAESLRALRAEGVLGWREYALCLYPESILREFFAGLLHRIE